MPKALNPILVLICFFVQSGVSVYAANDCLPNAIGQVVPKILTPSEKIEQQVSKLKVAYDARANAENSLEFQMATIDVLTEGRDLLTAAGYECKPLAYNKKKDVSFFEILSAPQSHGTGKVIKKLIEQGKRVFIGGTNNGTRWPEVHGIVVTPKSLLLGDDFMTNSFLHEIRHEKLSTDVVNGIPSPVDAEIRNLKGAHEEITQAAAYGQYLSFQELSTHAKDIYLIKAGVKNLEVDIDGTAVSKIISDKQNEVQSIAKEISQSTKNALETVRKPKRKSYLRFYRDRKAGNCYAADINFETTTGKRAIMKVWLPELNAKSSALYSQEELTEALIAKVTWMGRNADEQLAKFK